MSRIENKYLQSFDGKYHIPPSNVVAYNQQNNIINSGHSSVLSSVTDNATGDFTVSFGVVHTTGYYAIATTGSEDTGAGLGASVVITKTSGSGPVLRNSNQVRMWMTNNSSDSVFDAYYLSVLVMGKMYGIGDNPI